MVKDQASSQFALRLNCPPSPATRGRSRKERSFSHVGQAHCYLRGRLSVSFCTHSGCLRPPRNLCRLRSPFSEWCSCLRFSTCVCTNCHFLKTFFLIFDLLPHCTLTKGTICKDKNKGGSCSPLRDAEFALGGMGQVSTLVHKMPCSA